MKEQCPSKNILDNKRFLEYYSPIKAKVIFLSEINCTSNVKNSHIGLLKNNNFIDKYDDKIFTTNSNYITVYNLF